MNLAVLTRKGETSLCLQYNFKGNSYLPSVRLLKTWLTCLVTLASWGGLKLITTKRLFLCFCFFLPAICEDNLFTTCIKLHQKKAQTVLGSLYSTCLSLNCPDQINHYHYINNAMRGHLISISGKVFFWNINLLLEIKLKNELFNY